MLSYSLPSQSASTPRVTLWRRLRRLGPVSPSSGVYILPALEECVESFQWLAQEIRQAQGEALVMRVAQIEGLAEADLVEQFNQARRKEFAELLEPLANLEKQIPDEADLQKTDSLQRELNRLKKQHADIARIDYFRCPEGVELEGRLNQLSQRLNPQREAAVEVESVSPEKFINRLWVTRPRPHVDRLACAWLIRRFIDPKAVIRYGSDPAPEEVAFDVPDAPFSHIGDLCTFEVMLRAFNLNAVGLHLLAEIVHEVDLHDGRFLRPEVSGLDAILNGWRQSEMTDSELENHGMALFEGLYRTLAGSPSPSGSS